MLVLVERYQRTAKKIAYPLNSASVHKIWSTHTGAWQKKWKIERLPVFWVYNKQQSWTQTEWCHQNHCSDSFWTRQSKIDQNITLTSNCFQRTHKHRYITTRETSLRPLNYSNIAQQTTGRAAQHSTALNNTHSHQRQTKHFHCQEKFKGAMIWEIRNYIFLT